ncbi:LysE family translocator [Neisseriaceae bacterium TC5R-5]|nr:LysE family translocator [Neisseriaceae bacterium TC5R-5]
MSRLPVVVRETGSKKCQSDTLPAMMISLEQSMGFLGAAVLITLAPGPDNLMVLSHSLAKGRRQGLVFAVACALGCLNHTLLAVLGVSAFIAASPLAFGLLKLAGGVYLLYLGWQAWASVGKRLELQQSQQFTDSLVLTFRRGLIANALNPKVVLFFLAFLPQFVRVQQGAVGWQIAWFGVLFTLQAMLIFAGLAYFSGSLGQYLGRRPGAAACLERIAGTVFIGLGLRLLLFL